MTLYHVNPESGAVGVCRAIKRCRFQVAHFASKEEAQANAEKVVKDAYEWTLEKEQLTSLVRKWLATHGIGRIPINWRPYLFDEETGTYSFGYVKEGKLRRELFFSEELRHLDPKNKAEIIPHELAHLVDRHPVGDVHGDSWKEAFGVIVREELPQLKLVEGDAEKYLYTTAEENERLLTARGSSIEMRYQWECLESDGHGGIVPKRPKADGGCTVCGKPRFWRNLR